MVRTWFPLRWPRSDFLHFHSVTAQQIQQSYDVLGFPLNTTFTSLERVFDLVFNTGFHKKDDAGLEFALAVRVFPYPNKIFSVWVYVASVRRKK
jgi:hypothetical protein